MFHRPRIVLTVKGIADLDFGSSGNLTANETYLDRRINLAGGSGGNQKLQPGHYEFPFSIQLPHTPLPSSIDHKLASVRYWMEADMYRPWPYDNHWHMLAFIVVECVNLRQEQVTNRPLAVRQQANLFFFPCTSGPIILTATTDRQGYCPGESIQVIAHLENNSHAAVRGLRAALIRKAKCYTQGQTRTYEMNVTQINSRSYIPAGQSFEWNSYLPIPEICIPTTNTNRLFKVEYTLLVEAVRPFFHSPMRIVVPIFIGTVPPSLGNADVPRQSTTGGTLNTAERVQRHTEHLFEQAEIAPLNPMPQIPVEILPSYNPEISNPEPFNPEFYNDLPPPYPG